MIEEHSLLKYPNNRHQKIWRYLDFTKFVDLIVESKLYFRKSDLFDDIFEGSLPNISAARRSTVDKKSSGLLVNGVKEDEPHRKMSELARKEKFLSCWHLNDFESAAMWNLYLKSENGVAIQSRFSKLGKALEPTKFKIFLSKVEYIDYDNDFIDWTNGLNPFIYKRKSFEHEKEARAILWSQGFKNHLLLDNPDTTGIKVDIDLNNLVENIYLSPGAAEWFGSLVINILNKYNYNINVVKSSMDERPIY